MSPLHSLIQDDKTFSSNHFKSSSKAQNTKHWTHHTNFNTIHLHKLFSDLKYKVPNTSFHSMKLMKFPINFHKQLLLTGRKKRSCFSLCSYVPFTVRSSNKHTLFLSFYHKGEQVPQCKYPSLKGEGRQNLGHWTDAWRF